jgi:hypothetical protein
MNSVSLTVRELGQLWACDLVVGLEKHLASSMEKALEQLWAYDLVLASVMSLDAEKARE